MEMQANTFIFCRAFTLSVLGVDVLDLFWPCCHSWSLPEKKTLPADYLPYSPFLKPLAGEAGGQRQERILYVLQENSSNNKKRSGLKRNR